MSSYVAKGPCVYLIKEVDTQICKIGCTSDLKTRFAALKNKCGYDLEIIDTISTPTLGIAFKLEAFLHKHFKSQHIRGEWFSFDMVEPTRKDVGKSQLKILKEEDSQYRALPIPLKPPQERRAWTWTPPLDVSDYISPDAPEKKMANGTPKKDWTLWDLLRFAK